MSDLTKILNNPEDYYPGNFDTPQRANALLTGLCQDAANEIAKLQAELTRLKASIALDKMAENARELGLSYEPAPVQGLPFGVGGGLVAIKTLLSRELCIHANTAIGMIDAILKEHPEAQPAPVQEKCFLCGERVDSCASDVCPKSAQPAVQEGRDWSLLAATQESLREHMAEIKRLKAAQPAPVQHDECVVCGDKVRVIPRPWVGLTDEEVEAYDDWADFQVGCGRQTLFDMVRDIDAKLKGKNHG
jgi:hypothetical protein